MAVSLRQMYMASVLRMRVMVYLIFAIGFASCVASAKIPVNIDDLDPLLECKRRDVSGKWNTLSIVTKDRQLTCRSGGEKQ